MEEHEKEDPKRRKRSGKETEKMISGHKEENDEKRENLLFVLSFLFLFSLSLTSFVFLPQGFRLLKYIPFVHTFLFAFNHLTSEPLRSIPFSPTIALSLSLSFLPHVLPFLLLKLSLKEIHWEKVLKTNLRSNSNEYPSSRTIGRGGVRVLLFQNCFENNITFFPFNKYIFILMRFGYE